ncbi:MAG TPA: metallophosphoesterase family protein [Anaerolineales bacterium]
MVTLGILSDTHIPDRAQKLDPQILSVFRNAGVDAILHAGDIATPAVLDELAQVAPVYAVRGNRDWVWLNKLPLKRQLEFGGVQVGLTHGHGRWWNYVVDRTRVMFFGFRLAYFLPHVLKAFPHAKVIVFGHTHRPMNRWINGQLLFNPGSPHFPDQHSKAPSVGLIRIDAGGQVRGEIIYLQ